MNAQARSAAGGNSSTVLILSLTQAAGGGAEAALRRVLGRLAREPGMRMPLVASPRGSGVQAFCERADVPWCPWEATTDSLLQNARASLALWRRWRGLRVRRLFAWGSRSFDWTALLARVTGTPVQGRLADHPLAAFHSRPRQRLVRWGAHRFSLCVLPSHALARTCAGIGWTVPFEVVYNAFEPMPPRTPSCRLPVDVGFLGAFVPLKGIDVVAGWVRELSDLPIRWHLFGDASQPGELWRDQFRNLPGDRVVLHGHQPPTEIYRRLDVVVHPSQQFDASPNVLMEAASAGVPVVASDAGGSPEFVRHGVTGFLFPVGAARQGADQLTALVLDSALRSRFAQAARVFFEEFTAAHDCGAAYRRILAG